MRDMMKQTIDMMNFACEEFAEDLVIYYYGEGSPGEKRRIENHVGSCTACRSFLDDLHRLLPQTIQGKEPPAAFWDQYLRETVEKLAMLDDQRAWWRKIVQPIEVWVMPALGTAAAAVLAVALLFGHGEWELKTSSLSKDKIPQEILADGGKLEFFNSLDLLESLSMLEKMDGSQAETTIVRQL